MDSELKIYLGIDWGEKRLGLALADSEIGIATPFKTVGNFEELEAVIKEETPDIIVLGQPAKMSGEREALDPRFLAFAEKLKQEFSDKKIEFIDERLSSQEADKLPGGNLKAPRDEMAAMIILQSYLERKN